MATSKEKENLRHALQETRSLMVRLCDVMGHRPRIKHDADFADMTAYAVSLYDTLLPMTGYSEELQADIRNNDSWYVQTLQAV